MKSVDAEQILAFGGGERIWQHFLADGVEGSKCRLAAGLINSRNRPLLSDMAVSRQETAQIDCDMVYIYC